MRILLAVICLLSSLYTFTAEAGSGKPVSLSQDQLSFDFASQDGELTYDCKSEMIDPVSRDLKVQCRREESASDIWNFTVHLRLFVHERPTTPKLGYEFLYWVTDEQIPSGQTGKYTGSTVWINLDEKNPLVLLEAGQDIQDTWVLTVHIKLN